MSEKMAKMKNHDCPLGVSYVAIKAEKRKKIDWKEMLWRYADILLIAAGLIFLGAASTMWLIIR